jgi:hypothetical protein
MDRLENTRGRGERIITGWAARRILASVGIPVVRETLVFTLKEALAAARRIGFPVALHRWSPIAAFLPDTRLDLPDETTLAAAFEGMCKTSQMGNFGALVQEKLHAERPLRASYTIGSTSAWVSLGIGGVYGRLVKDEVRREAPLDRGEAREMIKGLRAAPLLRAYRGLLPLALDVLERILEQLGRMGWSLPELQEIHVDTILARGASPVCLEARLYVV